QEGKLAWMARGEWNDGAVHALPDTPNAASYLYREIDVKGKRALVLSLGSDDGIKVWLNGKLVLGKNVGRAVAPDQDKVTIELEPGRNRLLMKISNMSGGAGFYFSATEATSTRPGNIDQIIALDEGARSSDQKSELARYYRENVSPEVKRINEELKVLRTAEA